uniref:YqaJ domain-containing protein n=1 Tax=Rhabditophanes sp. KR3021 TaxID=114890 RepID=A0AC35TZP5_9BILA
MVEIFEHAVDLISEDFMLECEFGLQYRKMNYWQKVGTMKYRWKRGSDKESRVHTNNIFKTNFTFANACIIEPEDTVYESIPYDFSEIMISESVIGENKLIPYNCDTQQEDSLYMGTSITHSASHHRQIMIPINHLICNPIFKKLKNSHSFNRDAILAVKTDLEERVLIMEIPNVGWVCDPMPQMAVDYYEANHHLLKTIPLFQNFVGLNDHIKKVEVDQWIKANMELIECEWIVIHKQKDIIKRFQQKILSDCCTVQWMCAIHDDLKLNDDSASALIESYKNELIILIQGLDNTLEQVLKFKKSLISQKDPVGGSGAVVMWVRYQLQKSHNKVIFHRLKVLNQNGKCLFKRFPEVFGTLTKLPQFCDYIPQTHTTKSSSQSGNKRRGNCATQI